MTGEVHYGTATSTQEDGTEEVSNVYVGDGVNTQTFELRHELFFGGHVEYALAIGHNSTRLDGVLYYLGVQRCDPQTRARRDSTVAQHATKQPLRQPGRVRVGGQVGTQRVLLPERRI